MAQLPTPQDWQDHLARLPGVTRSHIDASLAIQTTTTTTTTSTTPQGGPVPTTRATGAPRTSRPSAAPTPPRGKVTFGRIALGHDLPAPDPEPNVLGKLLSHRTYRTSALALGTVLVEPAVGELRMSQDTWDLCNIRTVEDALLEALQGIGHETVGLHTEVSNDQLRYLRQVTGRSVQRTGSTLSATPVVTAPTAEQIEDQLRALVERVLARPEDLGVIKSSAIQLGALRAAVAARREQVDRMEGYLETAKVLLRGELPL